VSLKRSGILDEIVTDKVEKVLADLKVGYEHGISNRLADAIIAEQGGEKVEVPYVGS